MEKLTIIAFILILVIYGFALTQDQTKPRIEHIRPDFMLYILNDSFVAVNHHFEWIDTIPINDIEEYVKWESNIDN